MNQIITFATGAGGVTPNPELSSTPLPLPHAANRARIKSAAICGPFLSHSMISLLARSQRLTNVFEYYRLTYEYFHLSPFCDSVATGRILQPEHGFSGARRCHPRVLKPGILASADVKLRGNADESLAGCCLQIVWQSLAGDRSRRDGRSTAAGSCPKLQPARLFYLALTAPVIEFSDENGEFDIRINYVNKRGRARWHSSPDCWLDDHGPGQSNESKNDRSTGPESARRARDDIELEHNFDFQPGRAGRLRRGAGHAFVADSRRPLTARRQNGERACSRTQMPLESTSKQPSRRTACPVRLPAQGRCVTLCGYLWQSFACGGHQLALPSSIRSGLSTSRSMTACRKAQSTQCSRTSVVISGLAHRMA